MTPAAVAPDRAAMRRWCRQVALAVGLCALAAPAMADEAERDIIRLVAELDGASQAERAEILQQLAPHGDAAVDVLLEFMQEGLLARGAALRAVAQLQSGDLPAAPESGAGAATTASPAVIERVDDPFARPESGAVHPPDDAPRHRVVGVAPDDMLNVRDRPGVSGSTIIGRLAPDATNVATGDGAAQVNGGTWVEVLYAGLPGGSGWVNAHYLEALPANAQPAVAPDFEPGSMMDLAQHYTDLDGYSGLDAQALERRFLEEAAGDDPNKFRAINRLGPLTRALLMLDAREGPQVHARYRIRYGMEQMGPYPPKAYTTPLSFVQIDRFDMGPHRMKALPGAADEDAARHVSYRMAMQTIQARTAEVISVSRAELTDAAAEGMRCLQVGCLDLASPAEQIPEEWEPSQDEGGIDFTAPYPMMTRDGTHSPAAVLDALIAQHGFLGNIGEETVTWSYPEPRPGLTFGAPFVEVVIDVNLAQDFAVDGVLRDSHLGDDALAVLWFHTASISSADPSEPLVFQAEARQRHPWRQ